MTCTYKRRVSQYQVHLIKPRAIHKPPPLTLCNVRPKMRTHVGRESHYQVHWIKPRAMHKPPPSIQGQYPDAHSHETRKPPLGPPEQTESYPQTSIPNPEHHLSEDAPSYTKRTLSPGLRNQTAQICDTMAQNPRRPGMRSSEGESRLPCTHHNRDTHKVRGWMTPDLRTACSVENIMTIEG